MYKRINNLIGIFLNQMNWGRFIIMIPLWIINLLTFLKVYGFEISILLMIIVGTFITWIVGALVVFLGWKDAYVRHQNTSLTEDIANLVVEKLNNYNLNKE
jgi:hypothetical protein